MADRLDNLRGSVDPVLTNLAQGFSNSAFVWDKIMPMVGVGKDTGQVPVFGTEHLKAYDNKRAPGADPVRISRDDLSFVSFDLIERANEITFDIEEEDTAKEIFDMEAHYMNIVMEAVNLSIEADVAAYCVTTTNYATGMSTTLAGNYIWSTYHDDSVPITDIQTGMDAVRAKIYRDPNTLILGKTAFDVLRRHPDIVATLLSGQAIVDEGLLGVILGRKDNPLDVIVASSMYNNAGTPTDLWGDVAILAYVPKTAAAKRSKFEPSYGYTFVKNGFPEGRRYLDHPSGLTKSVLGRTKYDYKHVMLDSSSKAIGGYIITNCVA